MTTIFMIVMMSYSLFNIFFISHHHQTFLSVIDDFFLYNFTSFSTSPFICFFTFS